MAHTTLTTFTAAELYVRSGGLIDLPAGVPGNLVVEHPPAAYPPAPAALADLPAPSVRPGVVTLAYDPAAALRYLTSEAYLKASRPLVSRLPFDYQRVPGPLRLAGQRLLARKARPSRDEGFPAWPFEPAGEAIRTAVRAALAEAAGVSLEPARWPGGARFAAVLSHDLDTPESYAAIEPLARLEEERGLRSCWCFVARYMDTKEARRHLGRLTSAGHEIAIHGLVHDNKLSYLRPGAVMGRVAACLAAAEPWGATGFRSPWLLWSEALEGELSGRFAWSSSSIDTAVDTPIAPRRGVCVVRPFMRRSMVEIPVTLPMDDSLLLMGHAPAEHAKILLDKVATIADLGGVAMSADHPEPHLRGRPDMLEAYAAFLDGLQARGDAWFALPRDIVARHAPLLATIAKR